MTSCFLNEYAVICSIDDGLLWVRAVFGLGVCFYYLYISKL